MTLDYERFIAIKMTRRQLFERLTDETNNTDKIVFTRKEVYYMLKHYPEDYWVDELENKKREGE